MDHSNHKKHKLNQGYIRGIARGMKITMLAFLCSLALILVIGGIVCFRFRTQLSDSYQKAKDILETTREEDFSKPTDTHIYDSDNQLIGTINSGHYEYASYETISPYVEQAYIAQEDRRFYDHHGIDLLGIARAGIALIKNNGEITQGGSTITQQVIKNTYLTQERTFERKLTEIMAAPGIERRYSKSQIIEFYCNTNFYANRCLGISQASRYYFDKTPKELTLWEAATLAGISNNPSKYDPVKHPYNSKEKRDRILDRMLECKMISEYECRNAKKQELTVAKIYEAGTPENYQTSYAIHCAALELMKNDGFIFQYVFESQTSYDSYKEKYNDAYQEKSSYIRNGGFEIYTSLNSSKQALLQEAVDQNLSRFTKLQENGKYALQGAAVCVDNQTGYVTAIVGGRGTEDEFNRGYLSKRQPGSTIKPLIDYAPAFETGYYYPSRLVDDHKFDDGPKNSSNRYRGMVSVREALNRSLNTVAWQVLDDIGPDTGISYLGKLHFAGLSYLDNGNLSMSIGGFTDGARVVDMAKGYSALANQGSFSNRTCIREIISQYDGDVYNHNQADEQVFTPDTAYMITDILKGTISLPYGTGYGLSLPIPSAGKTGTTNDNKDTWFCGYTKYYTTAVWVGYDIPKPMPGIYGKTYAGKIWRDFMKPCHDGLPSADWEMPSTVSLQNIKSDGEKTSSVTGRKDLFSSVLERKAAENMTEKQAQDIRKAADRALSEYENFEIQVVTDTYRVEPLFMDAETKINKLLDTQVKNSMMKRLNARHKKLSDDLKNWAGQIEQYEASIAADQQAALDESLQAHEKAIDDFKSAIHDLAGFTYKDSNVMQKLDAASTLLELCRGFDEYNALRIEFENMVGRINALPNTKPVEETAPLGPGYVIPSKASEPETEQIGPGVNLP